MPKPPGHKPKYRIGQKLVFKRKSLEDIHLQPGLKATVKAVERNPPMYTVSTEYGEFRVPQSTLKRHGE